LVALEEATAGVAAPPSGVDLLWEFGVALAAGGGAFAAKVVGDCALGGGEDAHAHRASIMRAPNTAHGLFNVNLPFHPRNAVIEGARQNRTALVSK